MLSCSKTQSGGNCKSQLESGPTKLVPGSFKQTLVFPTQQFAVLNTSKAGRQPEADSWRYTQMMI